MAKIKAYRVTAPLRVRGEKLQVSIVVIARDEIDAVDVAFRELCHGYADARLTWHEEPGVEEVEMEFSIG